MKGSRYYKNLDFSKPVGTHRYVDNIKDRRQLAKVCLVAMARINIKPNRVQSQTPMNWLPLQ